MAEMQAQGKDATVLSGRRRDQMDINPGEGAGGILSGLVNIGG